MDYSKVENTPITRRARAIINQNSASNSSAVLEQRRENSLCTNPRFIPATKRTIIVKVKKIMVSLYQ